MFLMKQIEDCYRDYAVLQELGFSFTKGSVHTSRTIMSSELSNLFSFTGFVPQDSLRYEEAIVENNCLSKRSVRTRKLTNRHLCDLYCLDGDKAVFRSLLFFWEKKEGDGALLAFLAAYTRDSLLRDITHSIINLPFGSHSRRDWIESLIEEKYPDRFSSSTLKSTAQNINSSLTKTGHLKGRGRKIRIKANASMSALVYALFLNYLCDVRGQSLFETGFTTLLDIDRESAITFAENASRKGWMTMNRIGKVVEVRFPRLLTSKEMELLSGQNT